jgi:hypothetical protein
MAKRKISLDAPSVEAVDRTTHFVEVTLDPVGFVVEIGKLTAHVRGVPQQEFSKT